MIKLKSNKVVPRLLLNRASNTTENKLYFSVNPVIIKNLPEEEFQKNLTTLTRKERRRAIAIRRQK
jgi:hypothetical protein